MKAIEIQAFLPAALPYSSLKVSNVNQPNPKEDEALIRITHVSLHQVDLLFARGKHQNNNAKHGHVLPPFILGMDFAGVVERPPLISSPAISQRALNIGDKVMGQCYGACAEYLCVHPKQVIHIPSKLEPAAAAALVGGVVSFGAVRSIAAVEGGQTVLVTGANGGLGLVACQIAQARGAKVIGLVSSAAKGRLLRSQVGLRHIVAMDESDWIEEIRKVSPHGIDTIIDNVGLVKDGLRCLKAGGRIVIVGFAGRGGVMEEVAMNRVLLKEATVIGYRFGEHSRRDPRHQYEAWQGYCQLLASGKVRAVIDATEYQGLKDVPRALQDLSDRRLNGRAVVALGEGASSKL